MPLVRFLDDSAPSSQATVIENRCVIAEAFISEFQFSGEKFSGTYFQQNAAFGCPT